MHRGKYRLGCRILFFLRDVMPESPVRISLIVATRNRAPRLARFFAAIERLEYDKCWELIVADNGSTDNTPELVRAFAARVAFPVRYVYQNQPGNSNARNAGIEISRGELLAFTDDDCYVSPDLMTRMDEIFADPDVGFASGRILMHDPDGLPVAQIDATRPRTLPPRSFVPAGVVGGGNMVFRREAVFSVGGFDPLFGSGSTFAGEECDLAARISLDGWTGRYCPELVVEHDHEYRTTKAVSRFYDKGRGAYHTKLLVKERSLRLFLKGWLGLRWRMVTRPQTLWWELVGAAEYLAITVGRR